MNEADLRARSNAGDAGAQLQLAHLILTGRIPGSAPEAMALVNAAAEARHDDALLYHAALAVRGHGRPRSLEDALKLVEQAAATGDARARGQLAALGGKIVADEWVTPKVELVQHCAAPRIYTIKNFISEAACAWLMNSSRANLQRSRTQSVETAGELAIDAARTSSVAETSQLYPDIVLQLTNLRIARTTKIPLLHQEPTNILHYARGQQYLHHFDFIRAEEEEQAVFAEELRTIGQRVLTFLIYLNEDFEGGETEFPLLDWRFKGKPGDALMFWNISAAGERELLALHAGAAVTKGEKWLLSKWVRQRPVPLM